MDNRVRKRRGGAGGRGKEYPKKGGTKLEALTMDQQNTSNEKAGISQLKKAVIGRWCSLPKKKTPILL